MGKKHFCFFQTAETGNRAPNSGVKGSGANHYPRAPAQEEFKLRRQAAAIAKRHAQTIAPRPSLNAWNIE